ncbi:hypothetical protein IQ268_15850 [Oculatella sp. LEGE 06141]|uniref:hypothetical protein n=1 Tax=Oculatella sp. LEGE 06141 TaxID=1828648 RepID=UPI0018817EC6|nr:hypothetical protein [Oculatella sp. LEGE 06141]MBE9180044.1 hypothetical protein [Oculatella sp. LEGE 06141]
MLLGIHLTLMLGPTIAVPAPPTIVEALTGVEVTHSDRDRSGFQLTFEVGRSGGLDLLDYSLLTNPLLRPFNRVVLLIRFNIIPKVLMDGIITQVQLSPSNTPGASTLTVMGEDVSLMMDMKEQPHEHPAQNESIIVRKIILSYPQYGLLPMVIDPPAIDFPNPTQRIPVQNQTDLRYLQMLAGRYGYLFYIKPGPLPMQNIAYWGPPERLPVQRQTPLSVNTGPNSNVDSIRFQYNSLAPVQVSGTILDSTLNIPMPVLPLPISTRIPLASQPALLFNQPNVRTRMLTRCSAGEDGMPSMDNQQEAPVGLTFVQAQARAQGIVDRSVDQVVAATGELDALHYGDILEARSIVGIQGAGFSYGGHFHVQSVTHSIRKGEYKQRFSLAREGIGSLTPVV